MTEILSLWRSPLDKVALSQAEALRGRQPQCSIGYAEDFSAMTIYNLRSTRCHFKSSISAHS